MNENYQWAQDNPPKPKTPFNWKRLRNTIVAAVIVIAVVIVVSTCYYTVDDKQQAETVVNDAKAYQNAQLPDAQAQADKLVQNAQYLKQKRINEATQQVAMFEAMYAEYAQNPDITKSRMYYEAVAEILPGVKVFINTGDGSNVDMLLPLESLVGGGN